jgi:hypothetical protein
MIVHSPRRGSRVILALGALALAWAAQAALSVDALLARLARPAPAVTDFIEAHFSALLARPLIVRGKLEYLGPDALARSVESPFQERTEVHGDDVTIRRGSEAPRHFSLARAPELRSLLASFAALIGGDRDVLTREFELDLHGDEHAWTLGLTPRDPRIRERIRSILVNGRSAEPRCLTTFEANGNTTVLLVGEAARRSVPADADRRSLEAQCQDGAGQK